MQPCGTKIEVARHSHPALLALIPLSPPVQLITAQGTLNMGARLGLRRVSPPPAVLICDKPRWQLRPESGRR